MDGLLCVVLHAIPAIWCKNSDVAEDCVLSYPCDPSTTVGAEYDLPCRFQRLEIFIRLEEGLDCQGVDDSERQEHAENQHPMRSVCGALQGASIFAESHGFGHCTVFSRPSDRHPENTSW
jgi:hypothetical protein